ncbi:hypothetical protein N7452_009059 [Penicillium brevicompactum]|uniref:Uncharacterized protein n=1 Tax=Penicillium brevicompactum TaxID=5074 RepID=A0A9W9UAV2_PENBR|nr:hypothetical protein N7452_009059 [Penicillium brevicompactum]
MNRQFNSDHHVFELDILDRGFLNNLLPFTKAYAYDGERQMRDIIDSETSNATDHFILYSGKESIKTIVSQSPVDIPKFISSFDIKEELLLVKKPSRTRAAAADEINALIREKLMPMGLYNAIQGFPSATVIGKINTRGKQPDYGWCPKRRRCQCGTAEPKMPSVVIEVAEIEHDHKFNSDVRYWLSPNDGNVKMCLTLRVDHGNDEIRLESWIRHEVYHGSYRIYRNQVKYTQMTKQVHPIVTGDCPFHIPFESLMLQPIETGRGAENDLIFSRADLERVAQSIWNAEWE